MAGWIAETEAEVLAAVVVAAVAAGGRMVANATEVASACNVKHLDCQTSLSASIERKGLFARVLNNRLPTTIPMAHWCPTDIPTRFTWFLAKATIAQQAARCRGTIGEFATKNESAVRLAPQTRCGRLWGKSRPRKMLTRSGTCRGTRGIGLATFSYKLSMTGCLRTMRRLTIICLICPAASLRTGRDNPFGNLSRAGTKARWRVLPA
jgi:hypothetical protein